MFGRLNFFLPFLVLFFIFSEVASSQTKLKGIVVDFNNLPMGDVLIALVDDETQNIISYVKTNDDGGYELLLSKNNLLEKTRIDVVHFGYKKQTCFFYKLKKDAINFKNFKLISENITLNEVIVESSPIKIKKDTIEFKASRFILGNEENIEDLLKKIPGLIVEKDGKIKYGKREIEKVMVDNEDLFGKGYKLLTKNMPISPVNKIEILKNFSDNSLLKGIEKSNKIALNLKLKEKFKRIWFGNLKSNLSIGSYEGFYNLSTNLMNFGKKNKHYLLTNFNNTGFETIGDVSEILTSIDFEGYYNNRKDEHLIKFDIPNTLFSSERTNFNNSELVSSSSIFNFSKNTKLKIVSFFNTDETFFFKKRNNEINTELFKYSYQDNVTYRTEKKDLLGKLEFSTSFSPKKDELLFRAAYKNNTSEKKSELEYNNDDTQEFLNSKNKLFDADLTYTNKISKKEAFVFKAKYNFKTLPQKYNIDHFFYNELINGFDSIKDFNQTSELESKHANLSLSYLQRASSKEYFNFEIGNHYVEDFFKTDVFLLEENSDRQIIEGFNNDTKNELNDLFLKSTYSVSFQNFELRGELSVNYLISNFSIKKKLLLHESTYSF